MQQIEQAIRISFAGSHVGVDQHVKVCRTVQIMFCLEAGAEPIATRQEARFELDSRSTSSHDVYDL